MAATKRKQSFHPTLRSGSWNVTADADLLLPVGNYIIVGAYFTGLATGLEDSGTVALAYPGDVANDSVHVTATGVGTVNLVWVDAIEIGYDTFDT